MKNLQGALWIVSAPSGGGKTSLVRELVRRIDDIVISISHTTRTRRPAEVPGVDYFFVDESTFMQQVDHGDFVEYAVVFNHFYGTSKSQISAHLAAGIDVVLDIDWQGAQQIKRLFPQAQSIFILPPGLDILQQRLLARKQDDAQTILHRMQRARDELSHFAEFDYLIVNDVFDRAADDLVAIVRADRLRQARHAIKEQKLLSFLLSKQ